MTATALRRLADDLPEEGSYSLWVGPLSGEAWFTHHDVAQHYAASTMKLPLVITAYAEAESGRLELDQPVAVRNDFRSASGSGRFAIDAADDEDTEPWRRLGSEVALRWLCHRALVRSSNLATNLVFEAVDTVAIAGVLDKVGACDSRVERGIEDAAARETGLDNLVTARDLARTLQALATAHVASRDACEEILSILRAQQVNDAIPRGLPADFGVAHKSGWVDGISHDAAVIYPPDSLPFVFVMCTTSELSASAARELIASGASAAWSDRLDMEKPS
ncbi:MAG: class A beta-lactamase-related serine hydrolase [Actinomycetota bacterium]|nr:class A beta-lactamase-related serine hydrolase [Actinomycetota bacterium]